MVYCCVPLCKSSSNKTKGISYHSFPKDADLRHQWLECISRQGEKRGSKWEPTDFSVVCSRHFSNNCFSTSTKRKQLLPKVLPDVFEDYPDYLCQKTRSRKRPKKRTVEAKRSKTTSLCDELMQYEELTPCASNSTVVVRTAPNSCNSCTKFKQRITHYQKQASRLKKKIKNLKIRISNLNTTLNKKEAKSELQKQFEKVTLPKNQNVQADFLMEQLLAFGKKKARYEVNTLKLCVVLQKQSPKAYRFLRSLKILHLPHPYTLKRFIGYPSGETGITSLVKARLSAEAKTLKNDFDKVGSLITDEMAIKPKLLYDRRLDAFLGQTTTELVTMGVEDKLANRLLCFIFRGISSSIRIPVAFYFTNGLDAATLMRLTLDVIKAVEEQGFIILRLVTDNLSVNACMFKMLNGSTKDPVITHPFDSERKLFLAFDQSHIIKNVRSQFLKKTFNRNGNTISSCHVKRLYKYQNNLTGVIKPVKFLTRKHLYPTNLEKMNVARAVQIFSEPMTAALKTMKVLAPEKIDDVSSLGETINFMSVFRKWFELHDVSNRSHAITSRNPVKECFSNANDERLKWLETDFVSYIQELQANGKTKQEKFSDETFDALCFTTQSTVSCIRHLLECGFHYVLSRHFSGDDVESLFSHLRQLGGYNDAMDSRTCIHAIETTLATGLITASCYGNVKNYTAMDTNSGVVRRPVLASFVPDQTLPVSTDQSQSLELPTNLTEMLKQIPLTTGAQPSLKTATVAMIGGYLVRIAEEQVDCEVCLEKLSAAKTPSPLFQLIFHQDRGGLRYPSSDFVSVLDIIADFIGSAINLININVKGIRNKLVKMISPYLCQKYTCKSCEGKNLLNVILSKFLNPLLDNWAKSKTDKCQPVKAFHLKPVKRKLLKLS